MRAERVRGTRDTKERVCPWCGCGDQLHGSTAAREQLGKQGAKMRQDSSAFPRLPGTQTRSLLDKREPSQVPPWAQCPLCLLEIWAEAGSWEIPQQMGAWNQGPIWGFSPDLHPLISTCIHIQAHKAHHKAEVPVPAGVEEFVEAVEPERKEQSEWC